MGLTTMELFDTIKEDKIQLEPIPCADPDRVLQRTMEKVNGGISTAVPRRMGRVLLVAAVVATLLLGTTVLANRLINRYEEPMDMLGMAFGDEEFQSDQGSRTEVTYYEQTYDVVQPTVHQPVLDQDVAQELVSGVQQVNRSTAAYEDESVLTVISHLYDPVTHSGVIYCAIENPNGISGYYTQSTGELSWSREAGSGKNLRLPGTAERSYLIPGDTTDTRLALACYYIVTGENSRSGVRVSLSQDAANCIYLDHTKFAEPENWQTRDGAITVTSTGILMNLAKLPELDSVIDGRVYKATDLANMDKLVIRFQDGSEYLVDQSIDEEIIINTRYLLNYKDEQTGDKMACGIFNRLVDVQQIQQIEINGEPIQ